MTLRMTHPDRPAHEIHVAEHAVERYASQGWRPVDEEIPTDTDGTDADGDA